MNDKIMFQVDGNGLNNKPLDFKYGGLVDVIMDDENVGNIIISKEEGTCRLSIEFFIIKQSIRAMGYGIKILESFKSYVKKLGFNSLTGTCSDELVAFYKKAGAYFEDKLNPNYPHINNKFYIEL